MTKNNITVPDQTEGLTEKRYSKKTILLVFVIVFFITIICVSISILAKPSNMENDPAPEIKGVDNIRITTVHRSKYAGFSYNSDMESSLKESMIATATISSGSPSLTMYCPLKEDLVHSWGTAQVYDGGWIITGEGGVNTKSTYNILGGSIEFDIDFSRTNPGINANIESSSPPFIPSTGYDSSIGLDCDGSRNDDRWCVEIDWIESNGKCGGATTFHTIRGIVGAAYDYYFDDNSRKGHMKISYDLNGFMTFSYENVKFNSSALTYTPTSKHYAAIVNAYSTRGALIGSTQWVGWVPIPDCGPNGKIDGSILSIENVVIYGSIVQGPIPNKCK